MKIMLVVESCARQSDGMFELQGKASKVKVKGANLKQKLGLSKLDEDEIVSKLPFTIEGVYKSGMDTLTIVSFHTCFYFFFAFEYDGNCA